MSEEIVNDSHIEDDAEEVFQDDSQEFDVREAFGLPAKKVENAEDSDDGEQSVNDKTPAKEEATTDSKKRVVKFNKEDREIDESEVDGLLQKGLALDKERERVKQSQLDLDRAAKLLGYKDHADLSAGLDVLEKQQQQNKQTELDGLREQMLSELEDNGVNRETAEKWINNHPLIKRGEEAIEKEQQITAAQAENARFKPLYDAYPELKALADKNDFTWYTEELATLSQRNDPLLAYEHLNKGTTQAQTKKQLEQKLIKEQQLRGRTKVVEDGEQENRASEELKGAFSMFGIDPKRAQKYAK